MPDDKQQKSFPMLPIGHWWQLRKKFKQSIPGVATDGYLATVLDMQANSARANVLPFLRQLGIINEDGKPTERAKLWRDDEHYAEVCKAILREVYPRELIEAVPDANADRARAERWFAHHTGAGEAAVRRMAALYAVLGEADASKQPEQEKEKKERPVHKANKASRHEAVAAEHGSPIAAVRTLGVEPRAVEKPNTQEVRLPGVNINLEIHISADATPDQIDQIFASMAKHIYPRD